MFQNTIALIMLEPFPSREESLFARNVIYFWIPIRDIPTIFLEALLRFLVLVKYLSKTESVLNHLIIPASTYKHGILRCTCSSSLCAAATSRPKTRSASLRSSAPHTCLVLPCSPSTSVTRSSRTESAFLCSLQTSGISAKVSLYLQSPHNCLSACIDPYILVIANMYLSLGLSESHLPAANLTFGYFTRILDSPLGIILFTVDWCCWTQLLPPAAQDAAPITSAPENLLC